tara:strand:+ start:740 stop:877 length:138 start_codon:yes stop_codon:yes gene_type:complete
MNETRKNELALPDLNESRGNLLNEIGDTIKTPKLATNMSAVLGSP